MTEELARRCEKASGADAADLLYEAWNTLVQADLEFRRFACTIIGRPDGKTNAGRFADLLDNGGFVDAAFMLVPEGWNVDMGIRQTRALAWAELARPEHDPLLVGKYSGRAAKTPALALCAAALRARSTPRQYD